MRTKKVTRHYCDFCSKGGFKIPTMQAHEAVCFSNPKRSCFMCENAMTDTGEYAKEFAKQHALTSHENSDPEDSPSDLTKEQVDEIRKAVDNCPACILSVLKQSGVFAFKHFDYKAEKAEWLAMKNREYRDMVMGVE